MQITPVALAGFVPAAVTGLAVTVATLTGGGAPAATASASAPVIRTSAPPATSLNLAPAAKAAPKAPAAAPKPPAPAPAASPAAPSPAPAAPQPAAPAQAPAAAPAPQSAAEAAFATCVAYRESTDNPAASPGGLYGIMPSAWAQLGYSGTASSAPVAVQTAAFDKLYAEQGTAPWAQYDGC